MKVLFCGQHFRSSYIFTETAVLSLFKTHFEQNAMVFNDSIVKVSHCAMEEVDKNIHDATIAIPFMTKFTKELIQKAPKLKMIMQYGVGLEGVDIPAASEKGIHVCKIDSEICGNAQSCAEHSIFLALSLFRDIPGMKKSLQTGKIGVPTGKTLYQSKVMIYGYGNIGKQLLTRLLAFGTKEIIVVSKYGADDGPIPAGVRFLRPEDFLNQQSHDIDILFLCCSQNANNIGLVNKNFLSHLTRDVYIVNVARVSAVYQSYDLYCPDIFLFID